MKKQIFTLMTIFMLSLNANAIIELRAGYGIQTPSDKDYNATATLKTASGFNLDAILELPLVPFGFGLRYESLGMNASDSLFGELETDITRTSLIVNYRLIDMITYAGLIGTIGFVNDVKVTNSFVGELKWDSSLTYSVGAEAGISLGLIQVGAELGYISANYEATGNNTNGDMDLSGIYAKALVGVGF